MAIKGSKLSAEHKAKIAKSLHGNTRRKGKPTKNSTKEKLKKALIGKNTGKRSSEARKRMSESVKKSFADGRQISGGRSKWYDVVMPDGSTQKVQGTYELSFAQWLLKNGMEFTTHTGRIPWIDSNNEHHTYLPDFWVPSWNSYVEIKSAWQMESDSRCIEKMQYVLNAGWNIKILTEVEMREIGAM